MSTEPRIYVACLASYNNGILHGEWIDASQDPDDIKAEIAKMLRASPEPNVEVEFEGKMVPSAEEWAIHDHDGFCGVKIGEYESIEKLATLAANLEEHGEAFALYVGNGNEWDDVSGFEESYQGQHKDKEDFAYRIMEDCYSMKDWPEVARQYFDYDNFARDLFIGDYWGDTDSEGNFHVFRSI